MTDNQIPVATTPPPAMPPTAPPSGYAPTPQAPAYPGKGLGIAGLILAFLLPPIGLVLSIVAKVKSKKAGAKNTPATAGIIIGAILTAIEIIAIISIIAVSATMLGGVVEMCAELGPGVWEVDGVTYTCG